MLWPVTWYFTLTLITTYCQHERHEERSYIIEMGITISQNNKFRLQTSQRKQISTIIARNKKDFYREETISSITSIRKTSQDIQTIEMEEQWAIDITSTCFKWKYIQHHLQCRLCSHFWYRSSQCSWDYVQSGLLRVLCTVGKMSGTSIGMLWNVHHSWSCNKWYTSSTNT